MNKLRRLPREHIAAYLLYLLAAIIITWPLVRVFSSRLAGHAFSDSYEIMRHMWWIKHAIQTGEPLFFQQPLLGYPDGLTGAWLWGNPLYSFPGWLFAFFMPLPAAYNAMLLLRLALNGWAMYWLVWYLTGRQRGPALLAGIIFMAYPSFQGQLMGGHAGLLAVWPVPLYLYVLFRLREVAGWRWIVLGATFFVISLWGSVLMLVFMIAPVTGLFILARLLERDWVMLRRVLLVVVLGGALALIFVLPVTLETLDNPRLQIENTPVRFSADLLSIVSPSFFHPLFGELGYTHRVLGTNVIEGPGYIGVIAALLAALAVRRQRSARWWLALGLIVWILSLGPLLKVLDKPITFSTNGYESFVGLPWAAFKDLPLLSIVRTPGRFNFTVALAVAALAGCGAVYPWQRLGRAVWRWPLLLLVIGGVLWEYQLNWPHPHIPGEVAQPIAALADRDDIRAVYNLPWNHPLVANAALYLQTGHQQPLVAGHVIRRTPVDPAKLVLLQETLDPALLAAAGADVVILHKEWDDAAGVTEAFAREQLGAPFYEDQRFAVWEVAENVAAPQFTTITPTETAVNSRAEAYLFVAESGWATVSARFSAGGRNVSLLLDDVVLHRWHVADEQVIDIPLPLAAAGYHTVALEVQPPCPQNFNASLVCRALRLDNLAITAFQPDALAAVRLEKGLQLGSATLTRTQNSVRAQLWWRFDQPRSDSDIRFVHVIDENGNLVAQDDRTLGQQPAQGQWAETVTIDLPHDLPAGEYQVFTGWYKFPDLARFTVLADTPEAQNGLIALGTLTIGQ